MMTKIRLLLLSLFINCGLAAQSSYDSLLTELNTKYPQEKIYIHTDKTYYNPGETIWLKAYIKSDNFTSPISTNIYAELLDEQNNVLKRKTMPITIMGANFDFDIPDTLKSSKIYLRAYTTWMLNFEAGAYTKAIRLIQPAAKKTKSAPTYGLDLFPEGGDLVADIESKIAFKTYDDEGTPFAVTGNVLDGQGKIVQTFSSVHNGMGFFNFKPEARKRYKAVWKDPSGISHESIIPNARTEAATLSVTRSAEGLMYTIRRSALASDVYREYIMVGQMHQQIVYAARINFKSKTEVTVSMPTDSLPDGILQLTIFNAKQEPVAERIVFLNNNEAQFMTDLHLSKKDIRPHAKNEIQVDVSAEVSTNLSVAVTDDIQSPHYPFGENILSSLLMSSDLKGYVHDPGYYFSNDSDSTKQHLDLLMLTNGWRRFKWQDMLQGKWPQLKYMPENYLSVQGNIYGLSAFELTNRSITGFLRSNKDVESNSFINLNALKDGSFSADNFYFFDTVKIYYQLNNDKNKKLTDKASFSFKNGFIATPPVTMPSYLSLAAPLPVEKATSSANNFRLLKESEEKQNIITLEKVTVTGKTKTVEQKIDEEYASGLFGSGNSRIFAVENDDIAKVYRNVLDYLQGKVAGLQISTDGFEASVSRRGSPTALFLNEMETQSDIIMNTPMSEVAMIKVFDPPFVGAFGGGAGGAIAVYTKKGRMGNTNVQGLNIAVIHGYSKFKEFFSPKYDTEAITTPDRRTTLYWNPLVFLDKKNKRITLPFFNNSTAKRIRIIIEGVNAKGQITREVKVFE